MHRYTSKIGPKSTPKVIKYLLFIIAILSFFCIALSPFFHGMNLYYLFSLSFSGMQKGFFWQLITYLFIIPGMRFDLNFLIHVVFNLYLLWIFGTSYIQYKSQKHFILLYFSSGIVAGLVGLFIMAFFDPTYLFAGNMIPLFALLVAWIRLNPHATFHILHSIPLKANWLIVGLIGLNLLIDLSRYDYVSLFASLTAIGMGYLFSLFFKKA